MSSDPQRHHRPSRARITRAMLAALCAVSLTLTPLIAPSASLAQSSPGSGQLVRTNSAPLPPPDKPPGGRGGGGEGRFPCRVKQCLEIVKQFCTSKAIKAVGGCLELARELLKTKNSSGAPRVLKGKDLAFRAPFNGVGFQVHHIVPQGPPYDGVANFAQAILQRVGIELNDPNNLAALRGPTLKKGTDGYHNLVNNRKGNELAEGEALQKRLAHADAQTRYYYQTVNEIFAKRFGGLIKRGKEPTKAQVEDLLQEIKNKLYNGDTKFIAPGKTPRARDLSRL